MTSGEHNGSPKGEDRHRTALVSLLATLKQDELVATTYHRRLVITGGGVIERFGAEAWLKEADCLGRLIILTQHLLDRADVPHP